MIASIPIVVGVDAVVVVVMTTTRIAAIARSAFREGIIRHLARVACGMRDVRRGINRLRCGVIGCTVAPRTGPSFCTTATPGMRITTGCGMSGGIETRCRE
jgi:hypothetical protein